MEYDCHKNPVLLLPQTDAVDRIIIDSGATMHMFCNASLTKNIRATEGVIRFGTDGITVPIIGIGGYRILVIGEVIYAPSLNINIISVSALDSCNYESTFGEGRCTTYDRCTGMTLFTGTEINGLYYLDEIYVHMLYGDTQLVTYLQKHGVKYETDNIRMDCSDLELSDTIRSEYIEPNDIKSAESDIDLDDEIDWMKFSNPQFDNSNETNEYMNVADADFLRIAAKFIETDDLNPLEILHKKMGHISEGAIKRALSENLVIDSEYTYNDIKDEHIRLCFECMKGRMKAFPRDPVTHDNWKTMEKIAIDFKGPFSIQSYHKKRGVMLISDYSSNFVYAYIVRTKAESVDALKEFHRTIVERYGYKVKVLQSDADCFFKGKK